jgi:hypothetical protein
MGYGVYHHFQQYFSYITAISVISEGNRITRRKPRPAASHWQTLSHNFVSSTPRHEQDYNSQR